MKDSKENKNSHPENKSFRSNFNNKYHGLIEKKSLKIIRNKIQKLFSLIFISNSSLNILNRLFEYIKVIQIIYSTLFFFSENFWKKNSDTSSIFNYFSIYNNINSEIQLNKCYNLLNLYFAILSSFYGLIFLIFLLNQNGFEINIKLSNLILIFFDFIIPFLIPFIFFNLTNIFYNFTTFWNFFSFFKIIFIFLQLFITLVFLWIYFIVKTNSFLFIDCCFQSVTGIHSFFILISTSILNILISILINQYKFILLLRIICLFVLFFLLYISYYQGGMISLKLLSFYLTIILTSKMILILYSIFDLLKENGILELLFCFFLGLFIFYFLSNIIISSRIKNDLIILDEIQENPNSLYLNYSQSQLFRIIITGFHYTHPICIDWSIFEISFQKWPKNQFIWFFYIKFFSIYPDEQFKLIQLYKHFLTLNIKGIASHCIKKEAIVVINYRDFSLNPSLQYKLSNLLHKSEISKQKLRRVWDIVIKGDIFDIEQSSKKAFESINSLEKDYLQLMKTFPNNYYVTRPFSRFLLDLKSDYNESKKISERTLLLQRGILKSNDIAYNLGLNTFKGLPHRYQSKRVSKSFIESNIPNNESNVEIDLDDDSGLLIVQEQNNQLNQIINNISIPSVKYAFISRTFIAFFCIILASSILFFYTSITTNNLIFPLGFLYDLSSLRTFNNQLVAFSNRFIFENLGLLSKSKPLDESFSPKSFGNTWEIKSQLEYLTIQATVAVQRIAQLSLIESNSISINSARSLIFRSVIPFHSFIYNSSSPRLSMYNLQASLMDCILQISTLLKLNFSQIDRTILKSPMFLNPFVNGDITSDKVSQALGFMNTYIEENHNYLISIHKNINKYSILLLFSLEIMNLIIQISLLYKDKQKVYTTLTLLPKGVVSSLSEKLRIFASNKDEGVSYESDNSSLNKQEDNVIKLFTSGYVSDGNISDLIKIVLISLLITSMVTFSCYITITILNQESEKQKLFAPHLNHITGAYSMSLGSVSAANALFASFSSPEMLLFTSERMILSFQTLSENALKYMVLARFGSENGQKPFLGFAESLVSSNNFEKCNNSDLTISSLLDSTYCIGVDQIYLSIPLFISSKISLFTDFQANLSNDNDFLSSIWQFLIYPIFDVFFGPMFEKIIPTIRQDIGLLYNLNQYIIIFLFSFSLLLEFYIFFLIKSISNHLHDVLRLLLHCSPSIILQIPKIERILSGDFSNYSSESITRNNSFYDKVFMELPEAIFLINKNDLIESCNYSCQRIFNVKQSEVINQQSITFFSQFGIDIINAKHDTIKTKTGENDYRTVEISFSQINQYKMLIGRDISQTTRYNKLIQTEKETSEALLSSILPQILVERIQKGEKNISFSVKMASIIFIDIVEFTPWCSKLSASQVMRILNHLFKKFDSILSIRPTLTKIKCIGDCYMAAGGIFNEINIPSDHARDSVLFALDAIDVISQLNTDFQEHLSIRIGINTDGPIIAGVIGAGKPTFEILGSPISIAQQMEHYGIPNMVHISRPVYELVYGIPDLLIKEKGTTKLKNGEFVTYLVQRKSKK